MKVLALVLLLGAALTYALPTRVPRNINCQNQNLAENAHVQDIICGIERVEEALLRVPEEGPPPCCGTSCQPKIHDNIHVQADIVAYYRDFILSQGVIAEHSSPESLTALLEVINSTLPIIRTSVHQVNEYCYDDVSPPDIPNCSSDTTFRPKCTVHMIRRSLQHLFNISRMYILPECSVCKQLNETSQREVEEFPGMVANVMENLVPSSCMELFTALSNHISTPCNTVYELHKRLENLTLWQNLSSSTTNNSLPEVTEVIERLKDTILPITAKALEALKQEDDCAKLQRGQCDELPTPELITSAVESALLEGSNYGCDIEPEMMVALQILNLIRYNSRLFNWHLQYVHNIIL